MAGTPLLPRLPPDFRPVRLDGQKVLVVGLGTFGGGLGAALHLQREGATLIVNDLRREEELESSLAPLRERAVLTILGRHPTAEEIAAADWIVASPAVKWSAPPLVAAAQHRVPVETELSLLVRLLPCPWLGVTGTNGKSTTTMLAGRTLAASGRRVFTGGNLGGSLLESLPAMRADDLAVLEVSSFQLEHLGEIGLGPQVAVVTNVTPDHLDRHGSFASYSEAKRSILARAELALLRRDDPICRSFGEGFRGHVHWYGEASCFKAGEPGLLLRDENLAVARGEDGSEVVVDLAPFRLRGAHNRLNLLAAAGAATAFGVPFADAARAGFDAPPLARRLNEVATVRGVLYVDDSVSTSPPALAAALRSFEGRIRLLAGGYDKGIDPEELVQAILARCERAYLYGAVAPALAERLRISNANRPERQRGTGVEPRSASWEIFSDLRAAFAAAARDATSGDIVLLSPGFASYDQFRNFTERGALFCALVADLATA